MKYFLKIIFACGILFCLGSQISFSQVTTTENFVMANSIKERYITTESQIDTIRIAFDGKAQTVTYLDGLGRAFQTVVRQGSGTKHDMVSVNEYDAFGRELKKYLPYVDVAGSNYGAVHNDWNVKQPAFYNGPLQGVDFDASAFSFSIVEASPLSRVLTQGAPGAIWQPNTADPYDTTKKTIKYKYEIGKSSDNIRMFLIDSNNLITSPGFYNDGEILIRTSIDEHNTPTKEFTDKSGHLILKRLFITGDSLQTYYLYDDLNQLRDVIQPEGVAAIPATGSWSPAVSFIQNWVFQYRYDDRLRMVMKKVPGADSVKTFYDQWDRMVLTQDGRQRGINQYSFTKYDILNRPIVTGLYTDSRTAIAIQAAITASSARFESINTAVNEGYTLSNTFPSSSNFALSALTINYYDSYSNLPSWQSGYGFVSEYGLPAINNILTGLPIATQVNILGTSNYLRTVNYYDNRYRIIQSVSDNSVGGKDRMSKVLAWDGTLLQDFFTHSSSFYPSGILTKRSYSYDHANRLLTVRHQFGTQPEVVLIENSYNELGQLLNKKLHNSGVQAPLQKLDFNYNIRGWLGSINKPDAATVGYEESDLFNMELDYTTTPVVGQNNDAAPQFNGNISEEIWKGGYDNDKNSFRFIYDKANRLRSEKYAGSVTSQWGTGWDYAIRYDENIDSLDRNGNIKTLNRATKLWNFVDAMSYSYTGNQLNYIDDSNPDQSGQGFKDIGGVDYSYDANGNLLKDGNKAISSILYNHLNLPTVITMTGKGTITYAYDAVGMKLSKTVVDQTVTPNKITLFKYSGAFTYKSSYLSGAAVPTVDTLELIAHEEGRLRPKKIDTTVAFIPTNLNYIYDYFLKDHLGNVRSVITTETQADFYAATMETSNQAKENLLFSGVNETRFFPKPVGFDTIGANQSVSKLNGNINNAGNKRVGPALVLKVMAGDTVSLSTYGWYSQPAQPPATGVTAILTDLASQFTGGATSLGGNKNGTFASGDITNMLTGILNDILNDRNANNYDASRPKAFLNWVVVDENFGNVQSANHKGAIQIPLISAGMQKRMMVGLTNLKIRKNGYLYVFVSNESNQDVYFDDLAVNHKRGPVLEETSYYPFGLQMDGLSSKANKGSAYDQNKIKFNGKELESNEFADGSGTIWEDFGARMYNPQIGRWQGIDALADNSRRWSPYHFVYDNPIRYIDLDGNEAANADMQRWDFDMMSSRPPDAGPKKDEKASNDPGKPSKAKTTSQKLPGAQDKNANIPLPLPIDFTKVGAEAGPYGLMLATGFAVDQLAKRMVEDRWWITYTKRGPNGEIYVGRCSGYGATPEDVLTAYDRYHRIKGFGDAQIDVFINGGVIAKTAPELMGGNRLAYVEISGYSAIRGREQQLYDLYKVSGSVMINAVNPVWKWNPAAAAYWTASTLAFGPLMPFRATY